MLLILFGYAQNEIWPLFSKAPRVHHFPDGAAFALTWQQLVSGFTGLVLQFIKAVGMCLIIRKYVPKVAVFFYVMGAYAMINLFLYWYNYCQWAWPFYCMWAGLLLAVVALWPRVRKMRKV